ncbi:hypothetical protein L1887_42479 [Cichorium endivia]|nr:hypothetical protein L1887_42479 [Cichorium endivia]
MASALEAAVGLASVERALLLADELAAASVEDGVRLHLVCSVISDSAARRRLTQSTVPAPIRPAALPCDLSFLHDLGSHTRHTSSRAFGSRCPLGAASLNGGRGEGRADLIVLPHSHHVAYPATLDSMPLAAVPFFAMRIDRTDPERKVAMRSILLRRLRSHPAALDGRLSIRSADDTARDQLQRNIGDRDAPPGPCRPLTGPLPSSCIRPSSLGAVANRVRRPLKALLSPSSVASCHGRADETRQCIDWLSVSSEILPHFRVEATRCQGSFWESQQEMAQEGDDWKASPAPIGSVRGFVVSFVDLSRIAVFLDETRLPNG